MTRDDINSLAHSKWNCKYHVVFAPEISPNGDIQANKNRYRENTKKTM